MGQDLTSGKYRTFIQLQLSENSRSCATVGPWLALFTSTEEWSVLSPHSRNETTNLMKSFLRQTLIAAVMLLGFAGVATADQIFTTPTGAVNPLTGQAVSATADFSQSGSTLTLTLTNTLLGIKSAGQLLTGITFTLSDGSGVSLNSQTGDLISIASNGTVTDLGTLALGWGFGSTGSNTFEACVICTGGVTASATPEQGIIGPGPYTSANSSILGNGPHNPFVNQSAVFTFNVPSNETVSDVVFSFGTQPGANVPTPEPSTLLLLGAGLCALAWLFSRRSHA